MKALFLYLATYSCSRGGTLLYVGLLADGQDPVALIKARYRYDQNEWGNVLINKVTGDEHSFMDRAARDDGETSYVILDLDQPGLFLGSFEYEGGDGTMGTPIHLTKGDFVS